jgi:hypothetical protein
LAAAVADSVPVALGLELDRGATVAIGGRSIPCFSIRSEKRFPLL